MKTFLVIGSNCFTGSHIVDALLQARGNYVIGVSRSAEYRDFFLPYKRHSQANFEFYQIDIVRQFSSLTELIRKTKPEVVINVAALSEVSVSNYRPVEYFETNTLATVKLGNFLRQCPFRFRYVHISSAEIFGVCENMLNENSLFNPSTPYAASKAAADMYLNTLVKNFGFPATVIRSTNVYGKHQQLFKIIPRTVIYIKLGKTIKLHGGGASIKSFIHISDVVRGIVSAIEKDKDGTYHFSVASDRTIADIVRTICEIMGCRFEDVTRSVDERLGQDARYWLDCSRARKDLGWEPTMAFEQGLREVVDWIEDNWEVIKHEPLEYSHKE
jgi:dTDP-glucose 4,6-dehydratase